MIHRKKYQNQKGFANFSENFEPTISLFNQENVTMARIELFRRRIENTFLLKQTFFSTNSEVLMKILLILIVDRKHLHLNFFHFSY